MFQSELSKKFRKGCAAFRVEMAVCCNPFSNASEPVFNVKQECPEDDGLNLTPGDIPASAATEPTLAFLLSNNINKKTEEMAKEPPQTSSAG
ncbi:hypothetical protein COOONC_02997 [Cooperia oncophora]